MSENIEITNTTINQETQSKVFFPSSNLVLDICKSEYEREFERTTVIDTKVNIFLTLSTALLVFLSPLMNYKDVWEMTPTIYNSVIAIVYLFISAISSICAVVSIIIFIVILYSRQYRNINLYAIADEALMKISTDIISVSLIRLFNETVAYNRDINEKRMQLYKKGVSIVIIAIIFSVLCQIVKLNFI